MRQDTVFHENGMDIITSHSDAWLPNPNIWDIFNLSVLGLAAIAIIIVLVSKDTFKRKLLDILFISLIPYVGILYYYGRLIYLWNKRRKETAAQ